MHVTPPPAGTPRVTGSDDERARLVAQNDATAPVAARDAGGSPESRAIPFRAETVNHLSRRDL